MSKKRENSLSSGRCRLVKTEAFDKRAQSQNFRILATSLIPPAPHLPLRQIVLFTRPIAEYERIGRVFVENRGPCDVVIVTELANAGFELVVADPPITKELS